jgi:error-prone DNA polymerase
MTAFNRHGIYMGFMANPIRMSYAELHCISNYSFLRGASHPEELVSRAAELGYTSIAITDECSLAGVVKAHVQQKLLAEKGQHIQLIIGSEFYLGNGSKILALANNKLGYEEISAFISLCRRRSSKGSYQIKHQELPLYLRYCLLIIIPPRINPLNFDGHQNFIHWLGTRSNVWVGYQRLLNSSDQTHFQIANQLATQIDKPMLACGNVHMHSARRKPLQDILWSIKNGLPVNAMGQSIYSNGENYLRPVTMLEKLYPQSLLLETLNVAQHCHFNLEELRYQYPSELVPPGFSASKYLKQLVLEGGKQRWQGKIPQTMQQKINLELQLIAELNYEYYFLTVHDVVCFARQQNILCQGRGSAANSVVCYCLFITEVDPTRIEVLFERFISKERNEPPDIDVDFEHERREEVIQYIYKKYSRERAALASTVITYRSKSAIRDVGKALGIDCTITEKLSGALGWWRKPEDIATQLQEMGIDLSPKNKSTNGMNNSIAITFIQLVREIIGFPRHLSQHVGGFIISEGPLSRLVPIENASMPERTVIQWDKDDIEALGLLKIDVLALGMLSAIQKMLTFSNSYSKTPITLQSIPDGDTKTYDMLCCGDSIGIFQVESRAQISMLPRLKPRKFYDLVIQVAIVRPGPIQGKMVHPYLQRREQREAINYENDDLHAVLARTLGVPIFQEQVIKLAMVAAGFSGGEADQLRRAMASWSKNGNLLKFRERLLSGMLQRNYSMDFAERVFEQMKGFGSYGFPESHAASFALLVYVSAWFKCHHPCAFYAALINSQPMGFYSTSQLIQDAKRHGIEVLPIDVQHSNWDCTIELTSNKKSKKPSLAHNFKLRLGLRLIKGLQKVSGLRIEKSRSSCGFNSFSDLLFRAKLNKNDRHALIRANATATLSGHRHQSYWENMALHPSEEKNDFNVSNVLHDNILLPAPSEAQNIRSDYSYTGFTLNKHPLLILRNTPPFNRCKRSVDLQTLNHKRFVTVAGIVTGRQRPSSASGVIFLTLEDETGNINIIIWKNIQQRFRHTLLKSKLLLVKGVMEKKNSVIHVIAGELCDHSEQLHGYLLPSRDFH